MYDVSTQSVLSGGAQIDSHINKKIIQLSQIFRRQYDYLLKDELERKKDEYIETGETRKNEQCMMEYVNQIFFGYSKSIATYISIGVCIAFWLQYRDCSCCFIRSTDFQKKYNGGVSVSLAMIAVAIVL